MRVPLILVWLAGCGTETGNPEGDVSLLYNARSRVPGVIGLEPGVAAVTVDAVWLRLDDVTLSPCGAEPGSAVLDGIGLADHGGAEAFEQIARIASAPWCGLSTALLPGAAGEDPLTEGASIVIEGSLGDGRGFAVVVDEPVAIELPLDAVVRPEVGAWLLTFDVGTWLEGAGLPDLTGDPVVVSAVEHPEAYAAIGERLTAGVQLHLDRAVDGEVDDHDDRLDGP